MLHSIDTKSFTPPRARLLVAAAFLSGVLVAGCAGSSPSPTVVRLGGRGHLGIDCRGRGGVRNDGARRSRQGAGPSASRRCSHHPRCNDREAHIPLLVGLHGKL
jgi:hypothetical protein